MGGEGPCMGGAVGGEECSRSCVAPCSAQAQCQDIAGHSAAGCHVTAATKRRGALQWHLPSGSLLLAPLWDPSPWGAERTGNPVHTVPPPRLALCQGIRCSGHWPNRAPLEPDARPRVQEAVLAQQPHPPGDRCLGPLRPSEEAEPATHRASCGLRTDSLSRGPSAAPYREAQVQWGRIGL